MLGVRVFVQAGVLLLLTRVLGPEQFGVFAGSAALAVFLGTLSTFGTHLVLLGEISKEPTRRELVLAYALPCTLLCGGVLLGAYGLIYVWLLGMQNIPGEVLLLVGITELLLQPLFLLMLSEHHALGRIAYSQVLQLLPMGLRLIAVVVMFFLESPQPLLMYAMGYAAASVIALIYGMYVLPARWPSLSCWRLPSRYEWLDALGYAAVCITKSGPTELDKVLALRLLPLGAAGLYTAAARVVGSIMLPVMAMTLAALPYLFRDHQGVRGRRLLRRMCAASVLYGLLIALALWFVAPIFNFLFGVEYKGVDDVVKMLCIAIPGMALRLVVGNGFMALGKPWIRFGIEVVGTVMIALIGWLLIDEHGVLGLSMGVVYSEWGMATAGILIIRKLSLKGRFETR